MSEQQTSEETGMHDVVDARDERVRDKRAPIERHPLEELQSAQRYGHWVRLYNGYSCKEKLVSIQWTSSWQTRRHFFHDVKYFQFICIDQSGFTMHGVMRDGDYPHDNNIFSYVEEWGDDIRIMR